MVPCANIYQISYAPEIRKTLDPAFNVIGDDTNPRPEWFEYWHIRTFLLNQSLNEWEFYGFFSPKFGEKTRITSHNVFKFIEKNRSADVITFSPYLDQSALFLNIIEQGWFAHPQLKSIFNRVCARYFENIDHELIVTTTENTVFCNFFVAKPDFWARWFEICEDIFRLTESGESELGRELAGLTLYNKGVTPVRTFLIERIATLIMLTESKWTKANYPSINCAIGKMSVGTSTSTLLALDALKRSYVETSYSDYLLGYFNLRHNLLKGTVPAELEFSPHTTCGRVFNYTQHILRRLDLRMTFS